MTASFNDRFGRIELHLKKGETDTYIVSAHGIIRLRLLRKYLKHLKELDSYHTSKFNHVVDTTRVKFANPLNPFYLRSISRLNNVNLYVVIVPSDFLRAMVNLTKWINKPDYVFKSIEHYDISLLPSS